MVTLKINLFKLVLGLTLLVKRILNVLVRSWQIHFLLKSITILSDLWDDLPRILPFNAHFLHDQPMSLSANKFNSKVKPYSN